MPGTDYNTAIEALMTEQDALREEFTEMKHEVLGYMRSMTNQFNALLYRVNSFAPPASDRADG
jgi:hypothetical protein